MQFCASVWRKGPALIAFIKALVPGALLSWLVSVAISGGGSTGGILSIHKLEIMHHQMAWSWPLFLAGTFLAWALLMMMD